MSHVIHQCHISIHSSIATTWPIRLYQVLSNHQSQLPLQVHAATTIDGSYTTIHVHARSERSLAENDTVVEQPPPKKTCIAMPGYSMTGGNENDDHVKTQ